MRFLGTFLFFLAVLAVAFFGFFYGAGHAIAELCALGGLGFMALMITWYKYVPNWVKRVCTMKIPMILLDLGAWYLGWTVLPDAMAAKGSFIIMHILFSLFLIFERGRLRGGLWNSPAE